MVTATATGCPRCETRWTYKDNEWICLTCGARDYTPDPPSKASDAARLLPSPEALAAMVETSKRKVRVKACKKCGATMKTSGVFICEKCRANNSFTFDCPACQKPRTMLKSKYEKRVLLNKNGIVYCSQPCANSMIDRGKHKTFLCAFCRAPKTVSMSSYRHEKARLNKASGICCSRACAFKLRAS